MIFDIIKFGTFTADDFINAQRSNDFSKFTSLPVDLRKQFISDLINKNPTREGNKFKQAAIDFIDGKITEDQFRNVYWKYQALVYAASEAVALAAVAAVAAGAAVLAATEYYRLYFEEYASLLNKLIQEYESC